MPKAKSNPAPRGMDRIIPNANGTFTFRYWVSDTTPPHLETGWALVAMGLHARAGLNAT